MDREKNKKKILFISDFTFTHTIGWTEVATARLLNGLAEDGQYEVYLFSGKPKDGKMAIIPHPDIHIEHFLYLPFPGDKGYNNFILSNPIRMWRLFKKISPDLVHVHIPSPFGYIAVLMAKKMNKPLVYTNHMFSEHFVHETKTLWQKLARRVVDFVLSKYMGLFDLVVYPSGIQKDSVVPLYNLANKSRVISNGFIPFGEDVETERSEEWLGKTVFFTVSRLSGEKNIHVVIDAFDLLYTMNPNTCLLIIGDGVVRSELESYASTKSSHKAINFVGEKRGDGLAKYYKKGDIFISASSRESEGLTTLEAISFGKPIILSDASGNAARQFVDSNGFLFRDGNERDLAEKMGEFVRRPELIDIFGKRSLELCESYTFDHTLEKIKEVYKELIDK